MVLDTNTDKASSDNMLIHGSVDKDKAQQVYVKGTQGKRGNYYVIP